MKAAFYDLDGTLLSCNLVNMHAYYARNDRSLIKSVYQFTKVVLSVPLLFGLDLYSRAAFNRRCSPVAPFTPPVSKPSV